jgi:hypothetical protein
VTCGNSQKALVAKLNPCATSREATRRECFGAISGGIKVQGWGAIAAVRESWAVDFPPRSKKCGMPQKSADPKAGGDARGRG